MTIDKDPRAQGGVDQGEVIPSAAASHVGAVRRAAWSNSAEGVATWEAAGVGDVGSSDRLAPEDQKGAGPRSETPSDLLRNSRDGRI